MKNLPQNIIISRTDNLGDVMLTLPLAGYIKSIVPEAKIYFLGKSYTRSVIEASRFIDQQQLSQQPLTWHKTYSQGRNWYVVTTEPVATHVEALATAGRLEGEFPDLATWVRSLDSLRQAIDDVPR